jgi:hypothetical protein
MDPSRPVFSATEIRQLLGTSSKEEIYDKVEDLVMSPGLLLEMLGLEYVGPEGGEARSPGVEETETQSVKWEDM